MSKPWIPFYPSDFLAGTRGLTPAEIGIYTVLLMTMAEREEPIAMAEGQLARLCGCTPAAFKKAVSVLLEAGKLQLLNGGYWNERMGEEISFRAKKSALASSSARKKYEKDQQKQCSDPANAQRTLCKRDANHNHIQNKKDISNEISKKHQLPKNWKPTQANLDYARKKGLTDDETQDEADRFAEWFGPEGKGAGERRPGWNASWQSWVRRSVERKQAQRSTADVRRGEHQKAIASARSGHDPIREALFGESQGGGGGCIGGRGPTSTAGADRDNCGGNIVSLPLTNQG